MATYYERLKELRERAGLSQRELGELIGTTQQYYCRLEQGKAELDGRKIAALVQCFRVSADYILGLSDKENER